jgi:phosphoketolase
MGVTTDEMGKVLQGASFWGNLALFLGYESFFTTVAAALNDVLSSFTLDSESLRTRLCLASPEPAA